MGDAEFNERLAYRASELAGTVEEYLAMPCGSLRQRMAAALQNYNDLIAVAGWKVGDRIEVEMFLKDGQTWPTPTWYPAKVISVKPELGVEFSPSERMVLHSGISRRRPSK